MSTAAEAMREHIDRLREAGFSDEQAEAIESVVEDMLRRFGMDLVTNQSLALALAKLKNELVLWITGLLVAEIGITVAIVSAVIR